ncbi:hypothetical protein HY029_01415 [Candidatus Gottesmanbacteria bacterium]|nr:hypothetical protein [Candidatus Gottesmanbacteria bacterium]
MATPNNERSAWQRFLHGDSEWATRKAGYGTKAAIGLFFVTSLFSIYLMASNPAPKPIYGRAYIKSMNCLPVAAEKAPASYTIFHDQYQALAIQNPTVKYNSGSGALSITAGQGDIYRSDSFQTTSGPVESWKQIGPTVEMTGTQRAPQQGCVLTEREVVYTIR